MVWDCIIFWDNYLFVSHLLFWVNFGAKTFTFSSLYLVKVIVVFFLPSLTQPAVAFLLTPFFLTFCSKVRTSFALVACIKATTISFPRMPRTVLIKGLRCK